MQNKTHNEKNSNNENQKNNYFCPTCIFADSCNAQLKSGIVELVSWRIDETEYPLDDVEYTSISSKEDGFYTIKICFQSAKDMADYTEEELNGLDGFDLLDLLNDKASYYTFKIKNIKNKGKITKAKLTKISIENTDIEYIDDKAAER